MIYRLLVSIAGCLALVIGSCQSQSITLDSLCGDQLVKLEHISETRKLIRQNEESPVESCDRYRTSLTDLAPILDVVETGHICNLELVDKIRDYHMRFIVTSLSKNNEAQESMPDSLRYFFISLCFQISAECKMGLINNLEYDTKSVITDADYEQIRLLENYGATLLDNETEINDFDDILLLSDLGDAAGLEQDTEENKVTIKVKTNNAMRKLLAVCRYKFKPFYDKLIMPLVKLANLGYNYQGEMLERELEELKHSVLIKRWYNIVQTCEAFGMIRIYEDPDKVVDSDGEKRQMITMITKDEAIAMKGRNLHPIDEQISKQATGEEPVHYWPPATLNVDELWIKDQRELDRLVRQYKASATEMERVKSRLMRKVVAKIKALLKSGNVFVLIGQLYRNSRESSGPADRSNINEEMILAMDQAVEMDEFDKGNGVVPNDLPVALSTRGMVSRMGPLSRNIGPDIPQKITYFPRYRDGTKFSTKVSNWTMSVFPTRMTMLMWIIGLLGLLMLIMAVAMQG